MSKIWIRIWRNQDYSIWTNGTKKLLYNEVTKKVVKHYKQKQEE